MTSNRNQSNIGNAQNAESSRVDPSNSKSEVYKKPSKRFRVLHETSVTYADSGDCVDICQYCSALSWKAEHTGYPSKYRQCCKLGAIVLPLPLLPPPLLKELYDTPHFKENIRAYNNMFSMTSFGAKIDDSINDGRGPYVFKVSGQICHWIGTLCPPEGEKPRFLQMYIYDTENETSNRMRFFQQSESRPISANIVHTISEILRTCNEYVKLFKTASELCGGDPNVNFSIRLYHDNRDRRYDLPTRNMVGAILSNDDSHATSYDIVIHTKEGLPRRVTKLHSSYMPLQYPLLFPFAEQGWSSQLKLRNGSGAKRNSLTVNMYYSYQIHDRANIYTLLLHGGRLYQQYLVDAYSCLEQSRLDFIQQNQKTLRSEFMSGIHDAFSRGDLCSQDVGKRVFLPSSFTGGPRYMYKHYQDALALCRVYGTPQYFVTFTCNTAWPEITRHLQKLGCDQPESRPDIITRVFQIKVQELLTFVRCNKTFGDIAADLYTIEFQKRGLPHCHMLLWVCESSKIHESSAVDQFISAEIPDPTTDVDLYRVVADFMVHGPCGILNPKSPCMREDRCKFNYPKPSQHITSFDDYGRIHYRRRSTTHRIIKGDMTLDNSFIVPYNKVLLLRFNAHINVEYCGWSMLIKYLFKYIAKGADRIHFRVSKNDDTSTSSSTNMSSLNEIQSYVDGRFICPREASWQILDLPIHQRHPAVQILSVHLPNMQNVVFNENNSLQTIVNNPSFGKTTLVEWMCNNIKDPQGRDLTYIDYPSRYWWDEKSKMWVRRMSTRTPAVGRLIYVHPTSGELFYLRLLLLHQRGCTSFTQLRTVANKTYDTYQDACAALGLTGDDREWFDTFVEASTWASASELRRFFVHMLLFCEVTQPISLWETHWRLMSDDLYQRIAQATGQQAAYIGDSDLKQYVLLELENLLNNSSPPKSLTDFNLPLPSATLLQTLRNRLLLQERNYNRAELAETHTRMHSQLNSNQLEVYNMVTKDHEANKQTTIFVYGHGGTGKTFLWTTITSYFRSRGHIVLAVAASGIASLLLPSGRTAHSRFRLPFELTEKSTCDIKKGTQLADLLLQTSLIIWDEAPMSDRRCFESLDRSLRDIMNVNNLPFGGKSMVLGGDFRQTLPVKPKATKSEILASSLPRSYLWNYFHIMKLHINMRLTNNTQDAFSKELATQFADWLLAIGDGTIGNPDVKDPANTRLVTIPDQFLIDNTGDNISTLISFIYDTDFLINPDDDELSNRAIVCPKNETADELNNHILQMVPHASRLYSSHDSMVPHSQNKEDIEALYPEEYLHQLNIPGFPPHRLELKVKTPVMMLRNIDQTHGLCNGTRLIVSQLHSKVIEAHIITGTCKGQRVFIPRIKFVHNDKELPFVFTRRQFPIKTCYAMTINKSQGQSLNKIGIYLPQPVFTHGQLYVALSRATSPHSLKILMPPTEDYPFNVTKNVVFSEIINEIGNIQVSL